jgi:hypothetical protein
VLGEKGGKFPQRTPPPIHELSASSPEDGEDYVNNLIPDGFLVF